MKVTKTVNGNDVTFAFQGLWSMDFCEEFRTLMKDYVIKPVNITINMDEVIAMSVTGMKQITYLRYNLTNSGGSLKLINVDKNIYDKLAKLNYLDKMDVSIRETEEGSWL